MNRNPSRVDGRLATIRTLLEGITDANDERLILGILGQASAEELNEMLIHLDIDRLFANLNNRLHGPDHAKALLDLLCRTRSTELSLDIRAQVVRALQTGRTSRLREQAIRDLLLGISGPELTRFKNLLDSGGDHYDLEKLLFDDIDDRAIRQEILDHFAREAARSPSGGHKILSDIDDTVFARLHDDRFPSGTVYPGVFAFFAELDRGTSTTPGADGDLTFVTARPTDFAGLVEGHTRRALIAAGLPVPKILTGSVFALISHSRMAGRKLEMFRRYLLLFPEYDFTFIGDSGQGDIEFGRRMREMAPEKVRGVFIHDVTATPEATRATWAEAGITFFETYVGAAIAAYDVELMTPAGVQRVVTAAERELTAIVLGSDSARTQRLADLGRDIERAHALTDSPA